MFRFIKRGPKILIFFTSYQCNCRCIMCNIWKKKNKAKVLTLNQIDKLFSNYLINDYVEIVNLTGGEPTLDQRLEDIVKIILRRCRRIKRIDIPTNAVETEVVLDKIERILALLFPYNSINLTVTVALDGIGKVHEKIRGRKNIFNKVKLTITKLKELEELYPYFHLSLNTVVSKFNYNKLDEVIHFAQDEGLYLNLTPVAISEIGVESIKSEKNFMLNKTERSRVIDSLKKLEKVQYLSDVNKKYLYGVFQDDRRLVGCVFIKRKAVLMDPQGNMYMCGNFKDFRLGNIRNSDFDRFWQEAKLPKNWKDICSKCKSNCYLEEI